MDAVTGLISLLLTAGIVTIFAIRPEYLSAIGSILTAVVNFFGRIIAMAPKWVQILLFVAVGGTLIGFIVNGVVGVSHVCTGGQAYSGGLVDVTTANILPDSQIQGQSDVDWLGNTFFLFINLFTGHTPVSELMNGQIEYGTYYGDTLSFPSDKYNGPELGIVLAVQSDEVKAVENDFNNCIANYQTNVVGCTATFIGAEHPEIEGQLSSTMDLSVCKDVQVFAVPTEAGTCTLKRDAADPVVSLRNCPDQVAQIEYTVYHDNSTVKVSASYTPKERPNNYFLFNVPFVGPGLPGALVDRNITAECKNGGVGYLWLQDATGQGGWVKSAYAQLKGYKELDNSQGRSTRYVYINSHLKADGKGSLVLSGSDSSDVVQYTCGDSGGARFSIWGIDVFAWSTLLILIGFVVVMQFIGWIKKW